MAAVAAAVVASRQHAAATGHRGIFGRRAPPQRSSWSGGARAPQFNLGGRGGIGGPSTESPSSCVPLCMSIVLLLAGLCMLVTALRNERAPHVAAYDESVQLWTDADRARLARSRFNVTAVLASATSGQSSVPMQATVAADWDPHKRDSEGGVDLNDYKPLKFVAHLEFPLYFNSSAVNTTEAQWLPNRSSADTVQFRISASGGGAAGSASGLVTGAFPLVFSQRVHTQTPAPEQKCRTTQQGNWYNQSCHVVKRLAKICLQASQDASRQWQLHAPAGGGAHGCDPEKNWDPAGYAIDSCWGAKAATLRCEPLSRFLVEVTLRSAADPFLRAATLTRDKFDFGYSQSTEEVLAGALLGAGFLAMMPACCAWVVQRRRRRASREDCDPLSPAAAQLGQNHDQGRA